jgi:hypothetical protein
MSIFKDWLINKKEKLDDLKYGKTEQDFDYINIPIKNFNSDWKKIKLPNPPKNSDLTTLKELNQILNYRTKNSKKTLKKIKDQDIEDLELLFVDLLEDLGENLSKSFIKKISDVSEELSSISLKHKIKYDRPRPFQLFNYFKKPEGQRGKTTGSASYPSTHAVIGKFMGLWLSKIYPEHKSKLINLGKELGDNRVKAGFHFQSDCDAGNYLAKELFKKFKE